MVNQAEHQKCKKKLGAEMEAAFLAAAEKKGFRLKGAPRNSCQEFFNAHLFLRINPTLKNGDIIANISGEKVEINQEVFCRVLTSLRRKMKSELGESPRLKSYQPAHIWRDFTLLVRDQRLRK